MTSQHDPDLAVLDELSLRLSSTIRTIVPQQTALPTPCPGWNLAALVDHVTGGNWFSCRVLAGDTADDAMAWTMQQFAGGSAEVGRAAASFDDQQEAFNRAAALDTTWSHVVGELTGRQILRLRLHDLLVHSWDIEQTLRPPASLPGHLVAWGVEELASAESLTSTHFDLGDVAGRLFDGGSTAYLAIFGRSA